MGRKNAKDGSSWGPFGASRPGFPKAPEEVTEEPGLEAASFFPITSKHGCSAAILLTVDCPSEPSLRTGDVVPNTSKGPIGSPQSAMDCDPEIRTSTAAEFELRNKIKAGNFIIGELVSGGELSFIIENLPKDGTGCPGKWMFDTMMQHFGSAVNGIQGNWTYGVNLATVNDLTAKGASLEEAAKQTYTAMRARDWAFSNVRVVQSMGSPGSYSRVNVIFTK